MRVRIVILKENVFLRIVISLKRVINMPRYYCLKHKMDFQDDNRLHVSVKCPKCHNAQFVTGYSHPLAEIERDINDNLRKV